MYDLKNWECWKSLLCFAVSKLDHPVKSMVHFQVHATQKRRKVALADMLTSEVTFICDWKAVCSDLLNTTFRFSIDLQ